MELIVGIRRCPNNGTRLLFQPALNLVQSARREIVENFSAVPTSANKSIARKRSGVGENDAVRKRFGNSEERSNFRKCQMRLLAIFDLICDIRSVMRFIDTVDARSIAG